MQRKYLALFLFLIALCCVLIMAPGLPKMEDITVIPPVVAEAPANFEPIIEHSQITDEPEVVMKPIKKPASNLTSTPHAVVAIEKNASEEFYGDALGGIGPISKGQTTKKSETEWSAPVSAYSGIESCTNPGCIMASGKPAYFGAVACPREIPLGTKVIIHRATYTCEDRTAPAWDGRFDLFLGYRQYDHDQAVKFGLRQYDVTILK